MQQSLGLSWATSFGEDPVVCLINGLWHAGGGIDYSNFANIDIALNQVQCEVNPKIRPIRNIHNPLQYKVLLVATKL